MGGPHTAVSRTVARPNYPYPGGQGPDQIGGPRPLVHQIEDWIEGILPFEFDIRVLSDIKVFDSAAATVAAAAAATAAAIAAVTAAICCRWPKIIRPLYAGVGG